MLSLLSRSHLDHFRGLQLGLTLIALVLSRSKTKPWQLSHHCEAALPLQHTYSQLQYKSFSPLLNENLSIFVTNKMNQIYRDLLIAIFIFFVPYESTQVISNIDFKNDSSFL